MEENKETKVQPLNTEAKKVEKSGVNPEQMQAVLQQAEMRIRQMGEQLVQMQQMLRDRTIDQLFEVLKYSVHFDEEFITKSAKCIETYLSNVAFSNDATEEKDTDKENSVDDKEG